MTELIRQIQNPQKEQRKRVDHERACVYFLLILPERRDKVISRVHFLVQLSHAGGMCVLVGRDSSVCAPVAAPLPPLSSSCVPAQ